MRLRPVEDGEDGHVYPVHQRCSKGARKGQGYSHRVSALEAWDCCVDLCVPPCNTATVITILP